MFTSLEGLAMLLSFIFGVIATTFVNDRYWHKIYTYQKRQIIVLRAKIEELAR
jgi:hypothetical protein